METITENLIEPETLPETSLPDGLAAPEVTAPTEDFYPDTDEKVDWVLGQIADRRARAARIRENSEKRAKQEEAEAAFFEWKYGVALREFLRQRLEGGRRKSQTFDHGTLGFRTKAAGVQINDAAEALAWAEANLPSCLRVDKAALSKALLSSGEVVDFAAFLPAEEVFYIK